MYKIITILSAGLLLAACSTSNQVMTGNTQNAAMVHHNKDHKGSQYFPQHRAATGQKTFVFSPRATAWAAYDAQGNRIKTGRASGGKNYCADVGRGCKTVRGNFSVHTKKGAGCKSKKFPLGKGGAPMPHCMFFHKGYAIHGSYHVPDHNASHGCIRVTPSAAKWLHNKFMTVGTKVVVESY